jgi:hypothetical protein
MEMNRAGAVQWLLCCVQRMRLHLLHCFSVCRLEAERFGLSRTRSGSNVCSGYTAQVSAVVQSCAQLCDRFRR